MRDRELQRKNQPESPNIPPAPKPLAELSDRELLATIRPARERIAELLKAPEHVHHGLSEVMHEVSRGFAVSILDIISDRQDRLCSVPRNVSYLLCRMLTPASSTRIGQVHGGRDHSTVLTQIKKQTWLREKLKADPSLSSKAPVRDFVDAAIWHLNSRWE